MYTVALFLEDWNVLYVVAFRTFRGNPDCVVCCAVEVLASPLPLLPYELVLYLPVADAQ